MLRRPGRGLVIVFVTLLTVALCAVLWLRFDAHRPVPADFKARQGTLTKATDAASDNVAGSGQIDLLSDSGLSVALRVLRDPQRNDPLPILLILGGHRTGQNAIDLFGQPDGFVVVALDYPYEGPHRIRGTRQTLAALPLARRAFLDTPPAIGLAMDWVRQQPWGQGKTILIGASLGVPFAASAAAHDDRIDALILVHGAADNERWLTAQVARRVEQRWLHEPLGKMLYWLAYGPVFDTPANVARLAPRPVLIIGAREDERTPAGETQALFDAADAPRRVRWTDGGHVQPDRTDVIDQMMQIAHSEMNFLLSEKP